MQFTLLGGSKLSQESKEEKQKSELRTFRISQSLARSLKNESRRVGISTNALANQILRQYLEWQLPATEAGFSSIHRDLLRAMVANMDSEDLSRIGKEDVPNWIEHLAVSWYHNVGPDAILKTLVRRFEGNELVHLTLNYEGDTCQVVVKHDFGPNWSCMTEASLREIVTRYFHAEPRSRSGKSIVTVTFKVPPGLQEAMHLTSSSARALFE